MTAINIILLGSSLGLLLCINPIRRRPHHVRRRKAQLRAQAHQPINKWNAGRG